MTKNRRNNTEKSYSTTENGMPEGLKSDSSVQNLQNPPTKGCSFHTDEEDDDVVHQTPDIQISNNENDFDNETICSEELQQNRLRKI